MLSLSANRDQALGDEGTVAVYSSGVVYYNGEIVHEVKEDDGMPKFINEGSKVEMKVTPDEWGQLTLVWIVNGEEYYRREVPEGWRFAVSGMGECHAWKLEM